MNLIQKKYYFPPNFEKAKKSIKQFKMKHLITILTLFFFSVPMFAQEINEPNDSLRKDALKVYMDANDYIKREIPFINYVRDLKDAQIYIISTSEATGSGGREYTYFLEGQNEFSGMRDTVSVASSPDDTEDQRRQKQVSVLKMALMRYVVKTPLSKHVSITFTQPIQEEITTDKWNNWVFRSRFSGFVNGQKTSKQNRITGSFSASHITQDWKMIFDMSYNTNSNNVETDDYSYSYVNKSKSVDGLIVKSLSDHWSIGGSAEFGSSTYSNMDMEFMFMPGIEFNVFPYAESTRRQFKFLYSAGYNYFNYTDTTIYEKTEEGLWGHSLDATYSVIQKWGSINMGVMWSNYFHDWSLNNLSLSGSMEFRITKGLSVNLGGGASLIHDQISLVKGGVSSEEILTRQKELETAYSYFTNFGITYTFGSIFNNVVNPRFRNGGGGQMYIMY